MDFTTQLQNEKNFYTFALRAAEVSPKCPISAAPRYPVFALFLETLAARKMLVLMLRAAEVSPKCPISAAPRYFVFALFLETLAARKMLVLMLILNRNSVFEFK